MTREKQLEQQTLKKDEMLNKEAEEKKEILEKWDKVKKDMDDDAMEETLQKFNYRNELNQQMEDQLVKNVSTTT